MPDPCTEGEDNSLWKVTDVLRGSGYCQLICEMFRCTSAVVSNSHNTRYCENDIYERRFKLLYSISIQS